MKKIILLAFMIINLNINSQSDARWVEVYGMQWDSASSKKIDSNRVRFWYSAPIQQEQKNFLISDGVYSRAEVESLVTGKYGYIINCKTKESGIFEVALLNGMGSPVKPPTYLPQNNITMTLISPETNMEELGKSVCKYHKIKW